EAGRNLEAQRRAIGQSGAESLGEHFKKEAGIAEKSESNWTITFFVCMLLTVAIGGVVIKNFGQDWKDVLVHLAIVVPIVGSASYATRIAKHHRAFARWAMTAAVQVESVQAFATQLSDAKSRDSLILELGHNVFAPPQYGDASSHEHYSPIPADVLDAL